MPTLGGAGQPLPRPHLPTRWSENRTACLSLGVSLVQSPGSRDRAGESGRGTETVDPGAGPFPLQDLSFRKFLRPLQLREVSFSLPRERQWGWALLDLLLLPRKQSGF